MYCSALSCRQGDHWATSIWGDNYASLGEMTDAVRCGVARKIDAPDDGSHHLGDASPSNSSAQILQLVRKKRTLEYKLVHHP